MVSAVTRKADIDHEHRQVRFVQTFTLVARELAMLVGGRSPLFRARFYQMT